MKHSRILIIGGLLSFVAACCQNPNLEQSRQQILDLHASFIEAHLDKDAAFLAEPTADDYLAVITATCVP